MDRDIELWQKVKYDDLEAFKELYNRYYTKLMYIGRQLHCTDEVAKDLVHDTFVEIYERRKNIDIKSSFKFYLVRCFKSHLHRHLKVLKRQLPMGKDVEEIPFEFSIEEKLIHEQMDEYTRKKITQEVNQLSSRQREAMYYFYKEGLDYDEIMQVMSLKTRRSAQNLVYESIRILRSRFIPHKH